MSFDLIPPLKDPFVFSMIVVQAIWCWIVVTYIVDTDPLPFDVSTVFGILTATLGFILPLQLNAALNKNHSCLDNYNAFCGDVLAFSWECVGLTRENKVLEDKTIELQNIFHIIVALPALVKHHFRGTIDMKKASTLNGANLIRQNGSIAQQELFDLNNRLILKSEKAGMGEVEICFMKLLDYIKDFADGEEIDPVRKSLLGTWNRVYGSGGNMSNISSYVPPTIFTYVLNVALILYVIILPLTVSDQGLNAIWMVGVISYFFLGLNIAGKKVGNAFAASEDATGFQNVTSSQKATTHAIEQVWFSKEAIATDSNTSVSGYYF